MSLQKQFPIYAVFFIPFLYYFVHNPIAADFSFYYI